MAAPTLKMERIINYLIDVYQRCEKRKSLVERDCQDFRKLLQPWPPNLDPTGTKKTETANPETQSEKHSSPVEAINQQEAEELNLLEGLLDKAQRARERQAKIEAKIAKKEKTLNCRPPLPPINQTERTGTPVEDKENARKPVDEQRIGGHAAVISQSSLERLLGISKSQDLVSGSSAAKPAVTKRPISANRNKQTQNKSAVRQQYRTSSAEIGKHAKSQQAARARSNAQGHRGQRSQPGSRSGSVDRSAVSTQRSKSVERGIGNERYGSESQLSDASVEVMRTSSGMSSRQVTATSNVKDLAKHTQELNIKDSNSHCSTESQKNDNKLQGKEEESTVTDERFLLTKDGSKLCVPTKLKKLYANHHKLQQKISALLEKQSSQSLQEKFLERLKSTFPADSISMSVDDLVKQVEDMKNEYRHLIALTEMTVRNMAEMTEDTPWQELYRATLLINQIKARHREMQDELQNLILGEQQLYRDCFCGDCQSVQEHIDQIHMQQADKSLVPPLLRPGKDSLGLPPPHRDEKPEYLIYDNVKQLKLLVSMEHDITLLQIQIQMQKLIAGELLPLLQELDPKTRGYIELYRSVYALLHHNGKLFPAVIKDTIDDDSD